MGIAVGIDLGTTNSDIAVRRLNTSVLNNAEGEALTPSCVSQSSANLQQHVSK